jgi:thiol-disulfide isomerase/thioredoxin
MRRPVLACAVGCLLLAVSGWAQSPVCTANRTADLGFTLQSLDGESVTLSDYAGNVILLDFWATWCAPCRIEIPGFVEMVDAYGPRGFVELGMNYPVLDGNDRDDIKAAWDVVDAFPRTFVIGRDGEVCAEHTGYAPREAFEAAILSLL